MQFHVDKAFVLRAFRSDKNQSYTYAEVIEAAGGGRSRLFLGSKVLDLTSLPMMEAVELSGELVVTSWQGQQRLNVERLTVKRFDAK